MKRGIDILWVGEGYHKNQGPRSMLGQAITEAEDYAANFNERQEDETRHAVH